MIFQTLCRVVAILAVLWLAVATVTEARAAATPAKLSASDQADLAQVEHYLNGLKTMEAHFLQVVDQGAKGNQAAGSFTMWRPGRMRLVYDPPIKDFIVADGLVVFYWDGDLQQQSSQPLGTSLADFFLRAEIKLSGDVTVTRFVHQFGTIEVSIAQTDDPGKGELTLVLEDKPLQLRKWRVFDAQGITTTVSLSDVKSGMVVKEDLFVFRDPRTGTRRQH